MQAVISYKIIALIKDYIHKNKQLSTRLIDFTIILSLPLIWLFFEWLRSWVFTGFPWLYAGYSQTETILFNYAPIVGIYGLGFMVSFISSIIAHLFFYKKYYSLNRLWVLPIIIIAIAIYLDRIEWTKQHGTPIKITMIQGNISQHDRWSSDFLSNILYQYQNMSEGYWGKTDLLIWPENAIPTFYHYLQDSFYADIQKKVNDSGTIFITGLPFQNTETRKYYNSLLRMSENSTTFYYKQHLVPFGEYLPLDRFLRGIIDFFNLPMSNFSVSNQKAQPLKIGNHLAAISLCYEDSFPELSLKQLPEAHYLLNLSNNGWYGDSFAPHQHLQISRFRAMEAGRELIRSTTSGISAIIGHKGQLKQKTDQFIATDLTGEISPRVGTTPYVKSPIMNNIILVIVILLLTLLLLPKRQTFEKD